MSLIVKKLESYVLFDGRMLLMINALDVARGVLN